MDRCTFGMKTMKFYELNKNPGPGAHNYELPVNTGPRCAIGRARRTTHNKTFYTDQYYDAPCILAATKITYASVLMLIHSFGNEQRSSELKKSKYPGPGSYNIASTVGYLAKTHVP